VAAARLVVLIALGLVPATAGCGGETAGDPAAGVAATPAAQRTAVNRADAVVAATRRWAAATTLARAQVGAERARNLITGPRAPGAGDGDGDGEATRVATGLLPGEDGSPGLASPLATGCVERDVLGGSWADPVARWRELTQRIERWRPDDNTFVQLPSHAQRVVGWASLALRTDELMAASEYAGHAAGHARIVRDALRDPRASPCPG